MADKLLVVLANANLDNPPELVPPLLQATVAAAMEFEVEILLTGLAGRLAIKGEPESMIIEDEHHKTVYAYMQEARRAGVIFKVCTPAIKLWGEDLVPEIHEIVGGAYIINESMDDNVVTFTY
jgi:predicted peroxiredoxin